MGQSEVLNFLEKRKGNKFSVGEIAKGLNDNQKKVSNDLNRMLQYNEVNFEEIDRIEAKKRYNCKRRMKIYSYKGGSIFLWLPLIYLLERFLDVKRTVKFGITKKDI